MIFHRDSKKRSRSWIVGIAVISVMPAYAATPNTPEQEVAQLAKTLKPIPNDEWKKIAGEKITEKYQITQGDTLYDISKRLFGDAKYWPKIWALNNGSITNPHMIRPGNAIAFAPGTGTSLPSVSVETAENETNTVTDAGGNYGHPNRAKEWQTLPTQEWENVQLQVPSQVDPLGFDSRSKVKTHKITGIDLPIMATTKKIQPLGRIFASETESEFISLNELVFIHNDGDLQIGQSYSLTDDPEKLENSASDRVGYAYPLLGRIKILQIREGSYIGMLTNSMQPASRGAVLIPLESKILKMTPIPGPSQMDGIVMLDRQFSTSTTVQHKFVFIDRGSNDGVSPGMIFRSYQHIDPNNNKRITKANLLINADIIVVNTSPKFCTGLVLMSYDSLTEGSPVTLLTDVSDLLKGPTPNQSRLEMTGIIPPDELDSLDHGNGLSDEEKRELNQLEKWKKNPTPGPSEAPIPAPGGAPTSNEELPPPPPENEPVTPPTAPEPAPEAAQPNPSIPENNATTPPPNSTAVEPHEEAPAPPANEPGASEGVGPPAIAEPLPPPPPMSE